MVLRSADFVLPVPLLQPKERPRFTQGTVHTGRGYRKWMNNVRSILGEWWILPPLSKGQVVSLHLKCPHCGNWNNRVFKTFPSPEAKYRARQCQSCDKTFRHLSASMCLPISQCRLWQQCPAHLLPR